MSAAALAERAARSGAALFALPERGVLEVSGADRVRWLNGMLTHDVAALEAAGPGAGCRALALTRQGRVVADCRVLFFAERIGLETARSVVPVLAAHLEKFVIADDVRLVDASAATARFALEGPAAGAVLAAAGAGLPELAPDHHAECTLAGAAVVVAAFAFTALGGRQLFVPVGDAERVAAVLTEAGTAHGLVAGDAELFELLRVEAGTPLPGREIDDTVLPDEAGLGAAVSATKGCYTGQEVVARMRSRGRVAHRLVGLRFPDATAPPPPGTALLAEGRSVGELTSAVHSPRFGAIGLGFVRSAVAEPGTALEAGGVAARVEALPFAGADEPGP